jgi:hypothetical protein
VKGSVFCRTTVVHTYEFIYEKEVIHFLALNKHFEYFASVTSYIAEYFPVFFLPLFRLKKILVSSE